MINNKDIPEVDYTNLMIARKFEQMFVAQSRKAKEHEDEIELLYEELSEVYEELNDKDALIETLYNVLDELDSKVSKMVSDLEYYKEHCDELEIRNRSAY